MPADGVDAARAFPDPRRFVCDASRLQPAGTECVAPITCRHRRPELSQHFLRDAATARAIVRRLAFSPETSSSRPAPETTCSTEALADAGFTFSPSKDERLQMLRQRPRKPDEHRVPPREPDPLPSVPYRVVFERAYAITAALWTKISAISAISVSAKEADQPLYPFSPVEGIRCPEVLVFLKYLLEHLKKVLFSCGILALSTKRARLRVS